MLNLQKPLSSLMPPLSIQKMTTFLKTVFLCRKDWDLHGKPQKLRHGLNDFSHFSCFPPFFPLKEREVRP